LLMGGVQQGGAVGLGDSLARVAAAPAALAHAVDQPGPVPGLESDERGQRHAPVAAAGDLHHGSAAAPAPGAAFRRP